MRRDYNDPVYKDWRIKVYKRFKRSPHTKMGECFFVEV